VNLAVVAAYHGPPPLTVLRAFTAWRVNQVTALVTLLGVGYLLGVRRLRARGTGWPASRTYCFVGGGMGSLLLAGCGFVEVYAGTLFWVRAVQNVMLLMISPMLCAIGAPLSLLREFLPAGVRATLGRVLRSTVARRLTYPLVITPVFVAPMPVLYLSPLYPASLRHGWVGGLVGLGLFGCGWMYFWTRFRVDPTPRRDPYLVSLGISVVEVVFDGCLGLFVWLGPLLAAGYYEALARPWGPSPRIDQIIGAGILWIGGDLAGLPFLGVVLRRMTGEDEREAAQVDAELDRAELDLAETGSSDEPAEETEAGGRPRLWWEDHPELAERFRRGEGLSPTGDGGCPPR
jgi:cytochrome c oxidase assembly factor CtaG